MRAALIFIASAAIVQAQTQIGDDARIETIRAAVLQYVKELPNFMCVQTTHRQRDRTGSASRWKTVDKLVERLSYFDRAEHYEVISINGKPSKLRHEALRSTYSSGEWASILLRIFEPASHTELVLEGQDRFNGHHTQIVRYRTPPEYSKTRIGWDGGSAIVGTHGLLHIDRNSNLVVHLTSVAELPPEAGVVEANIEVHYDFVKIGGVKTLLPVKSQLWMKLGRVMDWNVTEFRDYQKFGAASSIQYGDSADKRR